MVEIVKQSRHFQPRFVALVTCKQGIFLSRYDNAHILEVIVEALSAISQFLNMLTVYVYMNETKPKYVSL